MSIKTEFRGWLLEHEEKARMLRLKMETNREAVLKALSMFDAVDDNDGERAAALALEFAQQQITLKGLLAEITAKKKAFGEE